MSHVRFNHAPHIYFVAFLTLALKAALLPFLLEKLVANIADLIMARYKPLAVQVEVKKFSIPKAKHVAVSLTRARPR